MNFLLNLIPAPYRMFAEIGIALVLAAVIVAAVSHDRSKHEAIGAARVQAKWDGEKVTQQAAALAQAEANAKETTRRLNAQKDAQDAHDKEIAAARADADAARSALDRLRSRAGELAAAARRAASDPAAVGVSASTPDAAGVLADVLGKLGDRAQRLAEYADAARGAGEQCVRSYEALTP